MDRLEKILISKRNSGIDNINGTGESSSHVLMKSKSGRQKNSNFAISAGNNNIGANNLSTSSVSGGSSMAIISYLNGINNIVPSTNVSGSGTHRNNNSQFIEYYRDRGRQPYK